MNTPIPEALTHGATHTMDQTILGKIIATVLTGAIDAGAIATNPTGVLTQPEEVADIVQGFLSIWLTHPASGKIPQIKP